MRRNASHKSKNSKNAVTVVPVNKKCGTLKSPVISMVFMGCDSCDAFFQVLYINNIFTGNNSRDTGIIILKSYKYIQNASHVAHSEMLSFDNLDNESRIY